MYDPFKETWSHKLTVNSDPRESCCPLLHYEKTEKSVTLKILGTAFFISPAGLFITAKHVVEEYDGKISSPLHIMLLKKPNYKIANVIALHQYPQSDFAIGLVDFTNEGWRPKIFKLSKKRLENGTKVASFGYSKTEQRIIDNKKFGIELNPSFYEGEVLSYHENGFTIAKWPVYSHSFECMPGISGGPVFNQNNTVVHGACCTGFNPPPGGTFSDISVIVDEPIPFITDSWNSLTGISEHRPDVMFPIE